MGRGEHHLASALEKITKALDNDEGVTLTMPEVWAVAEYFPGGIFAQAEAKTPEGSEAP